MIKGESAQDFMMNLAKNDPRLKGLDLSNLNKTAENLYNAQGKDINKARQDIIEGINNMSNK